MTNSFLDQLKNLKLIFWGSFWSTFGIFGGYLLEYLIKIIIARNIGISNYGLIILLFTTAMFLSSFANLGLNVGASRYIAYYTGKGQHQEAISVIFTGFKILVVSSFIFTALAFLSKSIYIKLLLKQPVDHGLLNYFLAMIPIFVLAEFSHSCLRGYMLYKFAIFSKELLRRLATLFLVILILHYTQNLKYLAGAYFIGICLFFITSSAVLWQKLNRHFTRELVLGKLNRVFLSFSIPLFFSFLLKQFSGQIAIFFVGYYKTTQEVGLYSCALSFSQLVSLPLTTVLFMFVPAISELWSNKKQDDIQFVSDVLLKWLWLLSSLIFLFLLNSPKLVIALTFGQNFLPSAIALEILAIGHFFYSLLGLNGALLISFGNSRIYFIADFLSILFAIVLFPYLTDNYSYLGAAGCILIRFLVLNIAWLLIVKTKYRMGLSAVRYLLSAVILVGCIHLSRIIWIDSPTFTSNDIFRLCANLICFGVIVKFLKLDVKQELTYLFAYFRGFALKKGSDA